MDCINNKKKYRVVYIIIFFFLFPFLSLPILFKEIYNGKNYPLILIAIFMGGLSMFYFPFGDQYRYFTDIETDKYLSFDEKFDFDSFMIFRELNIVNIMAFVYAKANLTVEILRFTLIFISCTLIFSVFVDLKQHYDLQKSRNKLFVIFLILLLSVPYFLISYGLRNGFGSCILAYGVYEMFVKNKFKIGFFYFILATLVHYFFIIHTILFSLVYVTRIYLNRNSAIMLSILMYFCSMSLFSILQGRLEFLDAILDSYVYGDKYGADSFNWFSPKVKILWFNGIINTVVLFYVFLKLNHKGKYENVVYILLILCIFTIPFTTFFQRTIRSSVPIIAIYLVLHYKYKVVYKAKYLMLMFQLIAFLYPFWIYRVQYKFARLDKIIYSSLPVILTNHYDEKTVSMKVGPDGLWYE